MSNTPFEAAGLNPGRRRSARAKPLRRASLLIGATFLLPAAPAWAANECGVPPPGGGTVTCPPGEYPGGIDYVAPADLEILLQPGVVTRSESNIAAAGDLRLIGPTQTILNSQLGEQALEINGAAAVRVELDRVTGRNSAAALVSGFGSVTFIANSVFSDSGPINLGTTLRVVQSAGGSNTGVYVRVGSVFGSGGTSIGATTGVTRVEGGSFSSGGSTSTALSIGGPVVIADIGGVSASGTASTALTAFGGTISIRLGTARTFGAFSRAIILSGTGDVTLVADTVSILTNDQVPAIYAESQSGNVNLTVRNVEVGGRSFSFQDNSSGIWASSISGNVLVDTESVTILAAFGTGIVATSRDGNVRVDSAATTSHFGLGVDASSTSGAVDVVSGKAVTGGGAAIRATSDTGPVTVASSNITARLDIQQENLAAITARSRTGPVTVTSQILNGVSGKGIRATSDSGAVTVTAETVKLTGTSFLGPMDGIVASSGRGPVTIKAGTVSTTAGVGILATTDSGAISISADSVAAAAGNADRFPATAGPKSAGIFARSASGDIRIVSGTLVTQGDDSHGIQASSGSGAVTVTATDVAVAGARSDAIFVAGGGGNQVSVLGLVQSQQGLAVQADGGAAILGIAASGTVRGRIDLTGAGDRVDNAGLFDSVGTSQFGDGADLFANLAGGTLRSVNGAAVLGGLESLTNRGLIEMRDGATDDSLTLTGAYSGLAGARLGLDVNLTASTADRLVTGAATGSTVLDLAMSGAAPGYGSILLVDASAGSSPTAFTLGSGAAETPYLITGIRFDSANNDYLFVNGPGAATFETVRFAAMASSLWYESADAVAAQLDTARDGRGGRGIGLWLQGWSGEAERNGLQSFDGGTFDISFKQDFQGLQGGVDIRTGPVAVGITGGFGRSDATFLATGNPVDMQVGNLGAYVHGDSGLVFFNALAKFDWAELEIAPGAGLGANFDADLFGIQTNAGVRLEFGNVFAEPSVGLSWVQSNVEAFASGPATVGPGDGESLRARAGLRVGAELPLGGGALLPFAAVDAYEELEGRHGSDFTLGETLRLFDEPEGTRARAAAGLSFATAGFEAFVRGEMDFSGGADAKAIRAGVRLRF